MRVVGVMMARGFGSTLHRKNTYPLLGTPMVEVAMHNFEGSAEIDHFFVWTEDLEIQKIADNLGWRVIPRSRDELFYHGGFSNPNDWGPYRLDYMENEIGTIDLLVDLNCNYCVFPGEEIDIMIKKLLENPLGKNIFPVADWAGHLFQIHNDQLFPIWHCQDLDRQKYPETVLRGGGICVTHRQRDDRHVSLQSLFHKVPAHYIIDVHDADDVRLAEYYLINMQTPA